MAPFNSDAEEEQDDYGDIERMADRLGLQGEGRQNYIHDHMTQLGYQQVQSRESYMKPEPEGGQQQEGGSARWGFGRRQGAPGAGNPPRSGGQTGADGDRF